jgi:2-dehydro-3-deoxyphosphooctonate aldolase (KDO 8-P synthase)
MNYSHFPKIIAGPCALDSDEINITIGSELVRICKNLEFNYIFKASFDKANRLSADSARGVGLTESLEKFKNIKKSLGVQITTDVHETDQISKLNSIIDIFQIPALLSRQTDLIAESARTGKIVNIKKGQFMSFQDAILAAEKAAHFGAKEVWITERGTSFGYRDLIVDFRNMIELSNSKFEVFFDSTHSVQKPGAGNKQSSGESKYVPRLMLAAAGLGINNFFFETLPEPKYSISDGDNMIPLAQVEAILYKIKSILAAYKAGSKH